MWLEILTIIVGQVGEWNLSSGELITVHEVHDYEVKSVAISGDRIVTCDYYDVIRLFKTSPCLLVLPLY